MMKQLTQQQKLFVSEYIKTLDGENSVLAAGYKSANPKMFASKLLAKDFIIKEIKSQLKKQIDVLNVPKGYVIQKLLQIAEFSLEQEDILDKEGNCTGKQKLRDSGAALKALESLCKYLGFNAANDDKQEHKAAKIITISNLDEKKI